MIVTDNEDLAKRAKHLSTQAKADNFEYFHDAIGYNYRLTNVAAAIGLAQLEQLDNFIQKKHFIKDFYINSLNGLGDINFQTVDKNVNSNWWLFTIFIDHKNINAKFLQKKLLEYGIQTRRVWQPMNLSKPYKNCRMIGKNNSLKLYKNALSLPSSVNLRLIDQKKIINLINKFCEI